MLHPVQDVASFLQTVGRAALSGGGLLGTAVLLALGVLHVLGGLLQPVEGLLQLRRRDGSNLPAVARLSGLPIAGPVGLAVPVAPAALLALAGPVVRCCCCCDDRRAAAAPSASAVVRLRAATFPAPSVAGMAAADPSWRPAPAAGAPVRRVSAAPCRSPGRGCRKRIAVRFRTDSFRGPVPDRPDSRDRGPAPPAPPPPPPCVPKATWISRKVASARSASCSAFCSAGIASFHFWLRIFCADSIMLCDGSVISLAKVWNCGLASASSRAFMRSASDLACAASFSSCSARNLASSAAMAGSLEPFLYSFQVAAMISFWRCEIC